VWRTAKSWIPSFAYIFDMKATLSLLCCLCSMCAGAIPTSYRLLPMNDEMDIGDNWTVRGFEIYSSGPCGADTVSGLIPFESAIASENIDKADRPLNNSAYGGSSWDYWSASCGSPTPCQKRQQWIGFTVATADAVKPKCAKIRQCWGTGCMPKLLIQGNDGSGWTDLTGEFDHAGPKGAYTYVNLDATEGPSYRLLPMNDTLDLGDNWTMRAFEAYSGGPCSASGPTGLISPDLVSGIASGNVEDVAKILNNSAYGGSSWDKWVASCGSPTPCEQRRQWVGFTLAANAPTPKCFKIRQCYSTGCMPHLVLQSTETTQGWTDITDVFEHEGLKGAYAYVDVAPAPPPPPRAPAETTAVPTGWRLLPATDTGNLGDFWTVRTFDIYAGGSCGEGTMIDKIQPSSTFTSDGSDPGAAFDTDVDTYWQGPCMTCTAKGAHVGFLVDSADAKQGKCARVRQCLGTGCVETLLIQQSFDEGNTWVDVKVFTHAGKRLITYVDLTEEIGSSDTDTAELVVVFTLSGTVSDYGSTQQDAIKQTIASGAGVPVTAVALTIVAASVQVTATITVSAASKASTQTALTTGIMASASTLQTALVAAGVSSTVESAPSFISSASDLSIGAIVGIAIGGVVALVTIVVGVYLILRSRRNPVK